MRDNPSVIARCGVVATIVEPGPTRGNYVSIEVVRHVGNGFRIAVPGYYVIFEAWVGDLKNAKLRLP